VINNNIPYLIRNKIPNLLVFSAAAIAVVLMLASPLLPLSNPLLLQPVQAQTTTMTFQTPTAAGGNFRCANVVATVTFDAQGTASSSDFQSANITGGTFQVIYSATGDTAYSGSINSGTFTNDNSGGTLGIYGVVNNGDTLFPSCASQGSHLEISTTCSGSNENSIDVYNEDNYGSVLGVFSGAVECSQGGGTTQPSSSSSMTTGTAQDSDGDGDGIPDSSDRCAHNSDHRCFKEGEASTTTTTQQEQPSSNAT
jgi:hypothetical protein